MAARLSNQNLAAAAYNGSPGGRQTVSVSNVTGTQATAFGGGNILLLVNDGSTKCYFLPQTSSSGAVTTSTGVPLNPDEKMIVTLKSNETHVAFITSSGTTSALVFEMV